MISVFLASALIASLLASFAGGVMGTFVVVKRISFIAGSIAHAILGGLGFFLWLSRAHEITVLTPLTGALITAVLAALLISYVHVYHKEREDTIIAAVWAIGMSIGVLFISLTPGFSVELSNFLLGNILWVSFADLRMLFLLDISILIAILFFYNKFLLLAFDEEQAKLQGIHTHRLYAFLLVLIAMTTVILMQVVGIVLVLTVLTLPAGAANLFVKKLSTMMVLSVVFCSILCVCGTFLAFHLDFPIGATIALVTGISYVSAHLFVPRKNV